jgi:hypothetical protein
MTTKVHMLCDANGVPLRFLLSPDQASDLSKAQARPFELVHVLKTQWLLS